MLNSKLMTTAVDHTALVDELIALVGAGPTTLAARLRDLKSRGQPLADILNSLSVCADGLFYFVRCSVLCFPSLQRAWSVMSKSPPRHLATPCSSQSKKTLVLHHAAFRSRNKESTSLLLAEGAAPNAKDVREFNAEGRIREDCWDG